MPLRNVESEKLSGLLIREKFVAKGPGKWQHVIENNRDYL